MNALNLRIINTHDTEFNWDLCTTFIPKAGEIIIYDIDDNHVYERFKIGDGIKTVVELPFALDNTIESILHIENNVIYADGGRIKEYTN